MLHARVMVVGVNKAEVANRLLNMLNAAWFRERAKADHLWDERNWKVAKGYKRGAYYAKRDSGYYDKPKGDTR